MPVLASETSSAMSIMDSIGYSVLGFAIVFAVLIVLWFLIAIMARIVREKKPTADAAPAAAPAPAPVAAPAAAPAPVPAPGTAGEILLKNVSEKDAAMVMAIVANKLNKPLNELRFKSITEVK